MPQEFGEHILLISQPRAVAMDNKAEVWHRRHPENAGEDNSTAKHPEVWKINYEKSWLHRHCSSQLCRDKQAQKAGQLFSGLLGMNVLFLGSAFICSMIFNKVAITLGDVWIFLSVLKILALGWIAYYLLYTRRRPHAVLYQDAHAGPIWIKGKYCHPMSVCLSSYLYITLSNPGGFPR